MSNVRLPIIIPPSGTGVVPDTGIYCNFSAVGLMGSVSIANGGTNAIFGAFFQSLPVGPFPFSAAIQVGVFSLAGGKFLNFDDISFSVLGLIAAAGLPGASVQVIALQRPGIGSGGFI